MKIKSLICIGLIFLLVFLIHLKTADHDIYYLNISTDKNEYSYDIKVKEYLKQEDKLEKFINNFGKSDDRVIDVINLIEKNESILINNKNQTIKNALIKADLVTIFVGLNDINYKIGNSNINELYDYADSFLKDLKKLLNLVREYCKEDIVILGYYNAYGSYYDEYFDYINREVRKLTESYNLKFIKVDEFYNIDSHIESLSITEEEHKHIADEIINFINRKILKN